MCALRLVVGYPKSGNDFAFANALNFKLFDLIKQYASGKPYVRLLRLEQLNSSGLSSLCRSRARTSVLVFCNTRKGCTQAAEALAKAYKKSLSSSSGRASLAWPKPSRNDYRTTDKNLSSLLENGLAVHHAGMDANDRRLVERAFIEGTVSVVCASLPVSRATRCADGRRASCKARRRRSRSGSTCRHEWYSLSVPSF